MTQDFSLPAPSKEQARALNVRHTVWVTASAGSGKTLVLIYRVMALLLQGNAPERILCLTYTRAAAVEMQTRIIDYLSKLSLCSAEQREGFVRALCGEDANDAMVARASELYQNVLSSRLKIMTLHAFCRSLITRFPLEAKAAPNLQPMEPLEAKQMIRRARRNLLARGHYTPSLEKLSRRIHHTIFDDLLEALTDQRGSLKDLLETKNIEDEETLRKKIAALPSMKIDPDLTQDQILEEYHKRTDFSALKEIVTYFEEKRTDAKKGSAREQLQPFLQAKNVEEQKKYKEAYQQFFFTDKGTRRVTSLPKAMPEALKRVVEEEAGRLESFQETEKKYALLALNAPLLYVGLACVKAYHRTKKRQARLDYGDMIEKARHLLASAQDIAPWVLYRLDGGLDHILVDEAQDTNKAQWDVLLNLTNDFFTNLADNDMPRSLFIVGDEKQSIFSFQGANIDYFFSVRDILKKRVEHEGYVFEEITLSVSFRSLTPILTAVDTLFNTPENLHSIAHERNSITHISQRDKDKQRSTGQVAFWTFPSEKEKNSAADFAPLLAEKIDQLLQSNITLEATKASIMAGDILILLRTRSDHFGEYLAQALIERKIDVAAPDRILLKDSIAIADMMVYARFLLLPEDDLNLACLLKSSFIGLDDDALAMLAIGRKASLWEALEACPSYQNIYQWLLKGCLSFRRPYQVFSDLLYQPCPALHKDLTLNGFQALCRRLGPDITLVVDVFMGQVLDFESKQSILLEAFIEQSAVTDMEINNSSTLSEEKIRIMTTHAAKGLQAPIVILPHMEYTPKGHHTEWHWEESVPLYVPAGLRTDSIQKNIDALKAKSSDEECRLLYVAMTRAQDQLFLTGYGRGNNPKRNQKSWVDIFPEDLQKDLQEKPSVEAPEEKHYKNIRQGDVQSPPHQSPPRQSPPHQSHQPAPKDKKLPAWMVSSLKQNQPKQRAAFYQNPPSSPFFQKENALERGTTLFSQKENALERGTALHEILVFLLKNPDVKAKQNASIEKYLAASVPDPEMRRFWSTQLHTILEKHQGSPFLSAKGKAEIALSGYDAKGKKMFGRIDLLYQDEQAIYVTDFKTHHDIPKTLNQVPKDLIQQLSNYYYMLRSFYPKKQCHTAFLWMRNAEMMIMPEDFLKNMGESCTIT